jgi:Catalase
MNNHQLAQEAIPADEAKYIADLAERLKAKIIKDNVHGIMRRDAHPKMHGLVKAEFTVEADLAPELKVGLFKEHKTYQAWIRFSNQSGDISPDKGRDIRGMAIKLMGVPGEKILEQEKHLQTQDFILISTNVFVTKDVKEFDDLIIAINSNFFDFLYANPLACSMEFIKVIGSICKPLTNPLFQYYTLFVRYICCQIFGYSSYRTSRYYS